MSERLKELLKNPKGSLLLEISEQEEAQLLWYLKLGLIEISSKGTLWWEPHPLARPWYRWLYRFKQ